MSEGAIQTIMGREFRAIQQIVGRGASRSDVIMAVEKVLINMPNRREVDHLRTLMEDIRAELKQQRVIMQQMSVSAENTKNIIQRLR